jgi:hypothetical protein
LNTKTLIKKSKQLKINRQVMPFNMIKSILIMWSSEQSKTDIEELKTFGHELRNAGKEVVFLTYYPIKKLGLDMQENEIYKFCCNGDFNLFGIPKSASLKATLQRPFNLLINGCLEEHVLMNTIAVFSKSSFRIGVLNSPECTEFYEISIKPNGADLCENYLIEIGKCLNKITS